MSTYELGVKGEQLVVDDLRARGLSILATRFRAKGTDADVIAMTKAGTLLFVEVKTRYEDFDGNLFHSFTKQRKARLHALAGEFIRLNPQLVFNRVECGFAGVFMDDRNAPVSIQWWKVAFTKVTVSAWEDASYSFA